MQSAKLTEAAKLRGPSPAAPGTDACRRRPGDRALALALGRRGFRVGPWLLTLACVAVCLPAAQADDPSTGLWVGSVVVEKVNRPGTPGSGWDPEALLPAANPFTFRLLVHVDTNGQARLLQRVLAVWNPLESLVRESKANERQPS